MKLLAFIFEQPSYIYTMHNIFSNVFRFTSYVANLGAVSNNFNDSDQPRNLVKRNHELTDAHLLAFGESNYCNGQNGH